MYSRRWFSLLYVASHCVCSWGVCVLFTAPSRSWSISSWYVWCFLFFDNISLKYICTFLPSCCPSTAPLPFRSHSAVFCPCPSSCLYLPLPHCLSAQCEKNHLLLPLDAVVSLTQPFAAMDLVPLSVEKDSSPSLAPQLSKALTSREVELLKMSGYGPVGECPHTLQWH